MGGGKKYFRSRGKGETKSQGFFFCPALSQSPTVPLESAASNAELLGLGMLVAGAVGRSLVPPPQPCPADLPFGHPHTAQLRVLDGEEKVQDCRFHSVDLGVSGPITRNSSLSCPGLGPYGDPGKSQPLQTLFSSPALLLAVRSGGVHSWADGCENPRQRRLCVAARHHRLSNPPPPPCAIAPPPCLSYNAGVPFL